MGGGDAVLESEGSGAKKGEGPGRRSQRVLEISRGALMH
jgi:hypothetical protein